MSKYAKSYIRSALYFRLSNTLIIRFDYPASILLLYPVFARISITFLRSYVNILHCNSSLLQLFKLSYNYTQLKTSHSVRHYSAPALRTRFLLKRFIAQTVYTVFLYFVDRASRLILVNDQLDALFYNVFISTPLHVSSRECSSSGGPTCINTPSGITHSGG